MATNPFAELDEKPLSRFHVLAMITTGMGVFTDGYDLSSIGIVLPLVLSSFGLEEISSLQSGLLTGAALVGSAVGALVFGALAQKGRKKYYGLDVGLMAVAAIAQAFAPDLWTLIAMRFVLGIGVGADYVLSPTIMAEHSNRKDRGKKLGLGFSMMWGLGAIGSAVVLLAMRRLGVSPDLTWRIVLGAGAIPALSVLGLRRKLPESPRFLARIGGDGEQARRVIKDLGGGEVETAPLLDRRAWHEVFAQHARGVFGAALLWFFYDVVIYAGVLFGPSVIAHGMGMDEVSFTLVEYAFFYAPGTLLGCLLIDRMGRKSLTAVGFLAAGLSLFAFAAQGDSSHVLLMSFALYGAYNFTISFGPGSVSGSGLLGVELAPTRIRSIAQSVTVVGGRIGAAVSAFLFPLFLGQLGKAGVLVLLGLLSVVGAALALFVVPETKGRSLEEINADTDAVIAAAAVPVRAD